jgi:hypothetical protein
VTAFEGLCNVPLTSLLYSSRSTSIKAPSLCVMLDGQEKMGLVNRTKRNKKIQRFSEEIDSFCEFLTPFRTTRSS